MNRTHDKSDNYLDEIDNHIEYLKKENKNNQRLAGLPLQAHQPHVMLN